MKKRKIKLPPNEQYEQKEPLRMEPGTEYHGWASINSFGEMHFYPDEEKPKTEKEGAETLVRTEGVTITQTPRTFLIYLTFDKSELSHFKMATRFNTAMTHLLKYLKPKKC